MGEFVEFKIGKQKNSLKRLEEKLIQSIKNSKVQCYHCKAQHNIGDIDYVQYFHYNTEAYSEGWEEDYDEGAFLCSKCKSLTRFSKKDNKQLVNYKYLFKSILKHYHGMYAD